MHESHTRESAFATKISDLQIELKNSKKIERGANREAGLHKQQLMTLQKEFEKLSEKKDQLLHETKELKLRESRFNEEYNILEEENTNLQKAASKLKQALVEHEGLKVENKSLLDEVSLEDFFVLYNCCISASSVVHSAILFDSPCTQGSQQLKNEKCNLSKSGL